MLVATVYPSIWCVTINRSLFGFFTVSHRSQFAVWEETAGLCVAFRNPSKEGISRRGPDSAGWLAI